MARCQHYHGDLCLDTRDRCTADATHFLRDEYGKRVGLWCEEQAREIVTEYQQKLGWHWTMESIPQEATDETDNE